MVNNEETPAMAADDAPRKKQFVLARVETRVLTCIAQRLPAWIKPDHLTALGVLAALGIAASYVLANGTRCGSSPRGPPRRHWLGDSLDGTLARVRKIERPTTATTSTTSSTASPPPRSASASGSRRHAAGDGPGDRHRLPDLSINTYLETSAFGVFSLGYGRIGPTEARLAWPP